MGAIVWLLIDAADNEIVGAYVDRAIAEEAAEVWLGEYSGTLGDWKLYDGSYWARWTGGQMQIRQLPLQDTVEP